MKNSGLFITLACLVVASLFSGLGRAGDSYQDFEPRLIIIDDDVGMLKSEVKKDGPVQAPWIPITDPDGGLELIYALRDPSVKVLGVTCAMGCSSTEVCMKSAARILEYTGDQDVPVLRGADSADDLGKPTEAARFIVDAVMSNPGKVEIIATAPLTNGPDARAPAARELAGPARGHGRVRGRPGPLFRAWRVRPPLRLQGLEY